MLVCHMMCSLGGKDHLIVQVGDFGDDNRAGINRTLHRISCMRNRFTLFPTVPFYSADSLFLVPAL